MSDFVAECRREWKRLRVPDAVADEMAADLAADLTEAAAEGVSAEEVLGAGAADPRSFAASWAVERGVIESRPATRRPRTGSLVLAVCALLSAAAVASGVAILTTSSAPAIAVSPDSALVTIDGHVVNVAGMGPSVGPAGVHLSWKSFTFRGDKILRRVKWVDPATGRHGVSTANLAPVLSAAKKISPNAAGSSRHAIAWILLIAGIVGLVLETMYWWRASRRQSPGQHPDIEERAASYA